jgi:ABC-type glycerol-3-phosphate transport system substrate-binding protein
MFIDFLISNEVQIFGYEANGMFPARISTFQNLGDSGKIDGWEVMSEQAKYLVPLPYNTPWFGEFETELKDVFIRVARKEVPAEKAIKDLAAFQQALKKEYE